ncbi:MAG: BrnA antitoxin family protein [Calditrichaceae bacterium]
MKRIKEFEDKDIDFSDIPEISGSKLSKAVMLLSGQRVPKGKVRINILLDADIVAYFKTLPGGKVYQTLINETLKQTITSEDIGNTLRRVIREELKNQTNKSA